MGERERVERRGGRPPREPASPSGAAPALLRWAASRGADVRALAARGGLEPADAEREDAPVTAPELAAMLAFAAELAREPHLALRLPSELRFRRYDAGALAARVAPTPRRALEAVARFAALVFPTLEARVGAAGGGVALEASLPRAPRGLGHHVDEYVLATALAHCRRGSLRVAPTRVWLTGARPAGDLGPLVRALGTEEIEFGVGCMGFELAREDADARLPEQDPMLVAAAEQLASAALAGTPRSAALASAVAARVEAALPGDVTADAIAAGMKMSARTLQRRLEDEGVRLSVVVDGVRERLAKRLLSRRELPLAEIAFRVGFSDLATFSRAFKRWTGVPPGAFRRGAIAGDAGATGEGPGASYDGS